MAVSHHVLSPCGPRPPLAIKRRFDPATTTRSLDHGHFDGLRLPYFLNTDWRETTPSSRRESARFTTGTSA